MRRPTHRSRPGPTVLASVAVASLVLGLSACSNGAATKTTSTTGPVVTVTSVPRTTTTLPSQVATNLYFIRGTMLGVALRQINGSRDPRYVTMQALLAGPSPSEAAAGLTTDIPAGTAMRGLQIKAGLAVINLSPEFIAPGPPEALSARLAEVVYTLTGYSNVKRVTVLVSKFPIPAFAGVNLSTPVGRSQVTAALPDVLLETPAVGSTVHGSLQISGLTAFTGTYDVQLLDATGRLLAAVTNTAVVGATFAQTVPFTASSGSAGNGTLRLFARPSSPSQPIQAVTFPVQITP